MRTYQPSIQDDILLLRWWHTLAATGDLGRAFGSGMAELGGFMGTWRAPMTTLFFETRPGTGGDGEEIALAVWVERAFSGALLNVWVADELRHHKTTFRRISECLDLILNSYPVLVVTTLSEGLANLYEKFGCVRVGTVPFLLDGEDAIIMYLTADTVRHPVAEEIHG